MPKVKTHKATAKRFRMSKGGKLIRRKAGQGHFNARESGVTTRSKRRDVAADKSFTHTIRRLTQYK